MNKQKVVSVFRAIKNTFKLFDLYGQNVNLFINTKPKFYSSFSGVISLGVIFIIVYSLFVFTNSWLNKEKMSVISSSISLSVNEILNSNQTYPYEFSYKNYYPYFVVQVVLPNGSFYINDQLKQYFTFNFTYYSLNFTNEPLEYEYCRVDHQDEFLGFDKTTIVQDQGKVNEYRICVKDPFLMGLFPDPINESVEQPEFFFSVYQCVNSTNNNNSCASTEEIDEMMRFLEVQTSIPNTLYDFRKSADPQKTVYDYQFIKLDKTLVKYYVNGLITTLLYTDYGLIYEDYRLMDTSFNPKIVYDPKIRKGSEPLFVFDFRVDQNFQIYYQRNQKLTEILGSLGGLINAIFIIGKLICLAYNSIFLKFKIINATFSNNYLNKRTIAPKSEINLSMNLSNSNIHKKPKFKVNLSFWNYLFPSKAMRMFYMKGSKHLHEYLDIRKIIKRLQDIDKLKLILLNENQRKMFECIPKPDIEKSFCMDILTSKQKSKTTNSATNKTSILKNSAPDNDLINQRILECHKTFIGGEYFKDGNFFLMF